MDNKDTLIKSLKANFRDSSDLAAPVISAFVKALNEQESYSPLLVEKLNTDGFEITSPSKQGTFLYEIASRSPLATSIVAALGMGSAIYHPGYSLPLFFIGVASASYAYYHYSYFKTKVDKGYGTLQSSKEDIENLLKSLLSLKNQAKSFPDDLMPVDLKAKNLKKLSSDIINILGKSIYINLEKSSPIYIRDIIIFLDKCKALYSSGSHPELYFYEATEKSGTSKITKEKPSTKTTLDLGSKPDFSVKEDAISEGIRMAKEMTENSSSVEQNKSKARKKPKSKPKAKETQVVSKHDPKDEPSDKVEIQVSNKAPESQDKSVESNTQINVAEQEVNSSKSNETEEGLGSPGDSMRTNEPVNHVFEQEDKELFEALSEKDDENALDFIDDGEDEGLPEVHDIEDTGDLDESFEKLYEELQSESNGETK